MTEQDFTTCNPHVDATFGVIIEHADINLLRVELVA
jgi:hypothetical protein